MKMRLFRALFFSVAVKRYGASRVWSRHAAAEVLASSQSGRLDWQHNMQALAAVVWPSFELHLGEQPAQLRAAATASFQGTPGPGSRSNAGDRLVQCSWSNHGRGSGTPAAPAITPSRLSMAMEFRRPAPTARRCVVKPRGSVLLKEALRGGLRASQQRNHALRVRTHPFQTLAYSASIFW